MLQESTDNAASRPPLVEVHTAEEDKLVLQIEPYNANSQNKGEALENSTFILSVNTSLPSKAGLSEAELDSSKDRSRRNAIRQHSECSSDDLVY